jgi:3-hydroxyisobutyrate dehydrogenase-like beta-hydroxyacid dehydrogenase
LRGGFPAKGNEGFALETIAVISLGLMGTPISKRLMPAGYRVTGFDVVREKMIRLAPLGMSRMESSS